MFLCTLCTSCRRHRDNDVCLRSLLFAAGLQCMTWIAVQDLLSDSEFREVIVFFYCESVVDQVQVKMLSLKYRALKNLYCTSSW